VIHFFISAPIVPLPVGRDTLVHTDVSRPTNAKQLHQQVVKEKRGNELPGTQENRVDIEEVKHLQEQNRDAEKHVEQRLRENKKDLQQIGDHYVEQVEKAQSEGKVADAIKLADTGLAASPNYDRLLAMKEDIVKKKDATINKLARKARQCLYENKLTTPAGDSAFFYYTEIMEINPGNTLARAGYQSIADRYASLADQAYRKFDLAAAERYVSRGLRVMPDHARLLMLKADLARSTPEKIIRGVEKNIDVLGKNIKALLPN